MPLEDEFDRAMLRIYERARDECGYNGVYFLKMVREHGGLETARRLLRSQEVSEGFIVLIEKGRPDLTMEALVLQQTWEALFTEEERKIAKARLER